MDRPFITAVGVVGVAVALALTAWPREPPAPPVQFSSSTANRSVTVHVAGAVERPGLVVVPADGRVADAIVAAGGATGDADLGALNLAAALGDGARLVVPAVGDVDSESAEGELVRVNAATLTDLQRLPGVGPVLAGRILAFRQANGSFETVEDLLDVPGIGEAKLEAVRDSILIP
jgi:competence protein ComEA